MFLLQIAEPYDQLLAEGMKPPRARLMSFLYADHIPFWIPGGTHHVANPLNCMWLLNRAAEE